jgi:hypothetical protein
METADSSVLAFCRTCLDARQRIVCAANVSADRRSLELPHLAAHEQLLDLISGRAPVRTDGGVELLPNQTVWLEMQET